MDKIRIMLKQLEADAWSHGYDERSGNLLPDQILRNDADDKTLRQLIVAEIQLAVDKAHKVRVFVVAPCGDTVILF